MLKWMSSRGKDTWQFLFWFFLFSYVPILPAYYIISLNRILGLIGLIYMVISWYLLYIMYNRFENYKNMKKSIRT
jgi:hypothetical protein